jgi:hypothetical protein
VLLKHLLLIIHLLIIDELHQDDFLLTIDPRRKKSERKILIENQTIRDDNG